MTGSFPGRLHLSHSHLILCLTFLFYQIKSSFSSHLSPSANILSRLQKMTVGGGGDVGGNDDGVVTVMLVVMMMGWWRLYLVRGKTRHLAPRGESGEGNTWEVLASPANQTVLLYSLSLYHQDILICYTTANILVIVGVYIIHCIYPGIHCRLTNQRKLFRTKRF